MNIFYVWIILVIVATLEPQILGDFDGQRLRSGGESVIMLGLRLA